MGQRVEGTLPVDPGDDGLALPGGPGGRVDHGPGEGREQRGRSDPYDGRTSVRAIGASAAHPVVRSPF